MSFAEKVCESGVECEMAEELMRSLGPGLTAETLLEESRSIRIRLQPRPGWKLSAVVFSRDGLRRLAADPKRNVKVEYLARDINRVGRFRREYHYPRMISSHLS
jgi:hypothetical protein